MMKETTHESEMVFDASAFVWELVDSGAVFSPLTHLSENQLASVRSEVERKLEKRQKMLRRVRGTACESLRIVLNNIFATDRFTEPPANSNELRRIGWLRYIADCTEQLQNELNQNRSSLHKAVVTR